MTYVTDHAHVQYAGKLPLDEQMRLVQRSHGQSGPNVDYVLNTVDHLRDMDMEDPELFALADQLRKV